MFTLFAMADAHAVRVPPAGPVLDAAKGVGQLIWWDGCRTGLFFGFVLGAVVVAVIAALLHRRGG